MGVPAAVELKVLRRDELRRTIGLVIGTRPSIIKQSAVIRELQRRGLPFFLIHTGQHYSYELDRIFFEQLELPQPDFQLHAGVNARLHGAQTAEMLTGIEGVLLQERPAAILVGGDANTNLAGALAARKLNIQVCHDEAGLRSHDWLMPEEHNRIMIDHISEYLFAPNEGAAETLRREQVRGTIVVTGSTIVDAVLQNATLAQSKSAVLQELDLASGQYVVMTIHHEETVDYREVLADVVAGARCIAEESGLPIVFPIHPRTVKRLNEFGLMAALRAQPGMRLVEPLGYFDMLVLLAGARLAMTDSGGIIQEACVLRVPCLTLGRATEWLETVEVGANCVAGTQPEAMLRSARTMLARPRDWPIPFGGRGPAARIVDVLEQQIL